MVKPEDKTEDASEGKRTSKKPARFGKANKADQKDTEDNEKADWMPVDVPRAVTTERNNLTRRWFRDGRVTCSLAWHKTVLHLKSVRVGNFEPKRLSR
jgi:hypothetical protein